jgi:dCTP deaminase
MSSRAGAIPYQMIQDMLKAGYVSGASEKHIQPSSLDLTVTDEVYRMRGSYLPKPGEPIRDIIKRGSLYKASLEYPLERGGIYLVKLAETLKLPPEIYANVSNKSSSGRIDLRARLLADGLPRFDSIPAGYQGSMWIEVAPKSFPVLLHPGDRINQIRFFTGHARLNALEHRFSYDRHHLLRDQNGAPIAADENIVRDGVTMTIDLLGDANGSDVIGWRSHPGPWGVLDTAKFDHDPMEFFEPIHRTKNGELTLVPGAFYILATKEKIVIPPNMAAEMANYDPSKGEFRSHFAGFFDPGFGWHKEDGQRGKIAVLEVEAFGHECVLHDGQPICLMAYERMLEVPERIYGDDLSSNYAGQQGPKLAKWFKAPENKGNAMNHVPAPLAPISSPPPSTKPIEPAAQPWQDDGRFDLG